MAYLLDLRDDNGFEDCGQFEDWVIGNSLVRKTFFLVWGLGKSERETLKRLI